MCCAKKAVQRLLGLGDLGNIFKYELHEEPEECVS